MCLWFVCRIMCLWFENVVRKKEVSESIVRENMVKENVKRGTVKGEYGGQ